jgi:CHAT domain-containing protein/tetratricopeptide (TPR) repeat protein
MDPGHGPSPHGSSGRGGLALRRLGARGRTRWRSRPRPAPHALAQPLTAPSTGTGAWILACVLAATLVASPSCTNAPSSQPSQDIAALDRHIAELRRAADFEAALPLAESRDRLLVDAGAAEWRRADSRRDLATLRRLQALPVAARSEWRESALQPFEGSLADSLVDAPGTRAALERWADVCARWLGRDAPEYATVLSDLALYHERHTEMLHAYELDRRAYEIRKRTLGPRHPDIAASLDHMSLVLKQSQGLSPDVMEMCEEALEMRRDLFGPNSREYATSLLRRANYHRTRAELRAALDDFAHAEAIFARTDGESSRRVAEVLTDRGLTLATDSRWTEAEPLLRRAVAIRGALNGPPDELQALALNQHGVALRELGRYAEAEVVLREAIRVQEARWRAASPCRSRAEMLILAAHRDLAELALARQRWTEAWTALDRLSNRVAVDAAVARGDVVAGADPWAGLLPRVQRALPDSAAMIGWLDSRRGGRVPDWPFWGFVVRKTGEPRWFRAEAPPDGGLPLRSQMRERMLATFAVADWPLKVDDSAEVERAGRELYAMRLAPMEPALQGVRTLIISSPDANLGVPLEGMIDGSGRYVADRFVTLYSPSALLYAAAREKAEPRPASGRWAGLLVGAPVGAVRTSLWDSLPPLGNAAREIDNIAGQLSSADIRVGRRATEAALDSLRASGRLGDYSFIHFATHAVAQERWIDQSALMLADALRSPSTDVAVGSTPTIDGWITAAEIESGWRLNAHLVSLAACRSSCMRVSYTSGPFGIGTAFLTAGARSVLTSMVPIEDAASELFFARFAWLAFAPDGPQLDSATAVHDARLWLRDWRAPDGSRPYANPALWTTFMLLGWPG